MLKSGLRILTILAFSTAVGVAYGVKVRGLPLFADRKALEAEKLRGSVIRATRGIELEEFKAFYESAGLVIDARPAEDFEKGHLNAPMILNIHPGDSGKHMEVLQAFMGQPVVIYCTSLKCDLAEQLLQELEPLGFGDIRIYFYGWQDGIQKHGLPTATGPAPDLLGNHQAEGVPPQEVQPEEGIPGEPDAGG